jgi:molybdate transport system substrate-binding protein
MGRSEAEATVRPGIAAAKGNGSTIGRAVLVALIASTPGGLAGCRDVGPGTSGLREVRVAAASDLKFALDDVIAAFQATHPGVMVTATYGSSGSF